MISKSRKFLLAVMTSVLCACLIGFCLISFNSAKTVYATDSQTLTATDFNFEGAFVRVDEDGKNGIKFPVKMSKTTFDNNKANMLETGLLAVLESDYNEETFVVDSSDTNVYAQDTSFSWRIEGEDVVSTVYIYNVTNEYLNDRFFVKAYAKMADESIVYSDTVKKSVAQVAYKANQDPAYGEWTTQLSALIPTGYEVVAPKADFEVYNGISGTTPTANELTISYAGASLAETSTEIVNANLGSTDITDGATASWNKAENKFVVSGELFGSTAYGDQELVVETNKCVLKAPLNVITKKIANRTDLENMIYYGGFNADTKVYGGYFELSDNIDMGNTKFYIGGDLANMNGSAVYNEATVQEGFTGIFDGKGHKIYNANFEYNTTGLFGNVSKGAVVKNTGVMGTIYGYINNRILCKNFMGTLENCYFDISATNTDPIDLDLVLLADSLAVGTLKDVVIKFNDGGKMLTGKSILLAGKPGQIYYGDTTAIQLWNAVTFNNVHFITTPNTGAYLSFYSGYDDGFDNTVFGEYANPVEPTHGKTLVTMNGITWHKEDATFSATMTDETYWNMDGNQPLWGTEKAVVNQQLTGEYEVYSGLDGTTPIANTTDLQVDVSAEPISVSLKMGETTKALTASDYTYSAGKLNILASAFGSDIFGDVEILVETENVIYSYGKTIVTKYIADKTDLMNLQAYGNIREYTPMGTNSGASTCINFDATNYKYSGYFVLQNDITISGTFAQGATSIAYNRGIYGDNVLQEGFDGIFNGNSKKITMEKYASKKQGGDSECGIFGNVSSTAIIKDLTIRVDSLHNGYPTGWQRSSSGIMGYSFAGTMQNVTIDVVSGDYYPRGLVAWYIPGAQFNNVVIKMDNSKVSAGDYSVVFATNYSITGVSTFTCTNVDVYVNSTYYLAGHTKDADAAITEHEGVTIHDYSELTA